MFSNYILSRLGYLHAMHRSASSLPFYLYKAMEIYVSYIYMNGYVCNQTVDFGKLWNTTIKTFVAYFL